MHCTIRNGSIGTALYGMVVMMSFSLTVGVDGGSEGLVADISPVKTFR